MSTNVKSAKKRSIIGFGVAGNAVDLLDLPPQMRSIPREEVEGFLNKAFANAESHGFECERRTLLPFAPIADNLEVMRQELRERDYDGIIIGNSVHLSPQLTGLLEGMVRVWAEETLLKGKECRLMMDANPGAIWETLQRGFADVLEAEEKAN